jgi:hypothetical protein
VAGFPLPSRRLLFPPFLPSPPGRRSGIAAFPPQMRFLLLFLFLAHVVHTVQHSTARYFLSSFFFLFRCSPSRPRTSPSRLILMLSCLPSDGGVSIFPGSGNSSVTNHEVFFLRRPIGAEPAFPARGTLAHFPHTFAGGRFPPLLRPPIRLFPPGGQVA